MIVNENNVLLPSAALKKEYKALGGRAYWKQFEDEGIHTPMNQVRASWYSAKLNKQYKEGLKNERTN